MTIAPAPLTHRPVLSRLPCPVCRTDALHVRFRCIHCGHDQTPPRTTRKAFGARLVLTRGPRR